MYTDWKWQYQFFVMRKWLLALLKISLVASYFYCCYLGWQQLKELPMISFQLSTVYFFFSISFILANLVNFFEVSLLARITYIFFSFSVLGIYLPAVRQMKLKISRIVNRLFKVKHRT
ncbi:hypothetical protein E0L10_13300 [Enterococcus durans]|uniref:hypothetical protein n=1 Tax=Enterococcus durans TaxID=53345 RepID=UPI0014314338|nr:hypothetical protein [Enterococcus durans]NJE65045.1 hypothetical protein [Enterococcus durans]